MSPVRWSVSPSGSVAPIIRRAEMYCELTSPGSETSDAVSLLPCINKGGNPSVCVYSMSAPRLRKASTRMRMGRCCMRAVPVRRCCSSGCTAKKAVRKRMAVPAAPMSTTSPRERSPSTITRVSSQSDRLPMSAFPPAKASRTSARLQILFEAGRLMRQSICEGAVILSCILNEWFTNYIFAKVRIKTLVASAFGEKPHSVIGIALSGDTCTCFHCLSDRLPLLPCQKKCPSR